MECLREQAGTSQKGTSSSKHTSELPPRPLLSAADSHRRRVLSFGLWIHMDFFFLIYAQTFVRVLLFFWRRA